MYSESFGKADDTIVCPPGYVIYSRVFARKPVEEMVYRVFQLILTDFEDSEAN